MARENLQNLHIYGEKTPFMERYIKFLAVAPLINGEYLLMTTQASEAVAFAKVYKEEHPQLGSVLDGCKRQVGGNREYFHMVYIINKTINVKTIIKH